MGQTPRAAKVAYVKAASRHTEGHTCHWPRCKRQVKPAFWGCAFHWYKLPRQLRHWIWQTYQPGQEINKNPSEGYLEAAKAVQEWIQNEGSSRI